MPTFSVLSLISQNTQEWRLNLLPDTFRGHLQSLWGKCRNNVMQSTSICFLREFIQTSNISFVSVEANLFCIQAARTPLQSIWLQILAYFLTKNLTDVDFSNSRTVIGVHMLFLTIVIQGDYLARGPKQIWEKYSRIWRNACAWMWKETSFSIDYEQVLFCIVPGMCI